MGAAEVPSFHGIPSATGGIARLACARLREAGKDVASVLAVVGLTDREIGDPAVRLAVNVQIQILDLVARELQDELLGFRLAREFDLREIGLVYYIIASSEKLSAALENAARYSRIANEGVHLRFNLDKAAVITLDYLNVDRSSDRHQIEFWLATLTRICRQVTDTRLAPVGLKLRHARVDRTSEFKAFFGCEVEFGVDADEIRLPATAASLPIVGRDSFLNRLLRQYADEALASRPSQVSGFRRDVEQAISLLLPHGKATLSKVARELGMSARTLSRKLQNEGVTFAALREELRAALARRYLKDREIPISEIAWLLGYREISSFTHAFKRWAGMTPRDFRAST
jgi:AraC-like DNA-binding protein